MFVIRSVNLPVLIGITNDCPAKGMTVPYTLRYNFGEDEDGNVCYTKWGAQSKHTPLLDEFLTVTKAWDDGPIPFTDNILPVLQKRILRKNASFQFVMKDGWINTLLDSDEPVGEPKQTTWGEWEEADKEVEAVWNEESSLPAPSDAVEPSQDEFDFGEEYK